MIYIIFKVVDKRAHMVIVNKITGAQHAELIPGGFFKKLIRKSGMVRMMPGIVRTAFGDYSEVLHDMARSTYYMIPDISNRQVINEQQKYLTQA